MNHYPLTEDQIRFYQENGYVRLDNVLTMDEVEVLRKATAQAVEDKNKYNLNLGPRTDEGYSKVFLQMVNLWERYPVLEDYVHNVRVAEIARKLTRSTYVRLWHDQALIKYPKDSKATAWHQDTVYWPMNEAGGLSCWMALDEVTVERGCMWFVPGSHKLGPLPPVDLGNVSPDNLDAVLPESFQGVKPVAVELKPGSCTFHNGLTFHYAGPNVTDIPRRAMVTIFMPGGTTYRKHTHIIGDRSNLSPGEEFHGPLFPILAREGAWKSLRRKGFRRSLYLGVLFSPSLVTSQFLNLRTPWFHKNAKLHEPSFFLLFVSVFFYIGIDTSLIQSQRSSHTLAGNRITLPSLAVFVLRTSCMSGPTAGWSYGTVSTPHYSSRCVSHRDRHLRRTHSILVEFD